MPFVVGGTIGPYTITHYIGQGGMATIYRAKHLTLDRDVALKVIHPALKEDQSFLLRLAREARIVAKLDHPNIVPVYDFATDEGTPYLVMRFIEGKTLKAYLEENKLDLNKVLEIMQPVADALSHAHSLGVLHRDIKPSNILMDTNDHIYLADFGLARLAQAGETTLSQDMIIGSPQYISPEQARGETADARADIYSLGVVLYEMLTGRVPFIGETAYQTMTAHINQPLPPARSVNPNISAALEQVLDKALAKDREQRYSSVREFMKALEDAARKSQEIKSDKPVAVVAPPPAPPPVPAAKSPPTQPADKSKLESNRKRLILVGGGILAVCILLACAVGVGTVVFKIPIPGIAPQAATPSAVVVSTPTRAVVANSPVPPSATASAPVVAPTVAAPASVAPASIAPPPPVGPRESPTPVPAGPRDPATLVPAASKLCEGIFSKPLPPGLSVPAPEFPFLTLLNKEYDSRDWMYNPIVLLRPATDASNVRSLLCIVETRIKKDAYPDGTPLYQVKWQARVMTWPDGVLNAFNVEMLGSIPAIQFPKPNVSEVYGSRPDAALIEWIRQVR